MLLFVGLGNPGARYAGNRHNIGFMAIDEIARQYGFGSERDRFQGRISDGKIDGEKILALKPQTFMNRSGQSVGEAMRYFNLPAPDVFVFHDEIDLAPGKVKVKEGGGHAGHNGLRDITAHIGSDYIRIRVGVGHPGDKNLVMPYVLSDFSKAEGPMISALCETMARSAKWLVRRDYPRFMTEIARDRAEDNQTDNGSGQ